ncbi:AcrR family transcriptional regulator [Nocardia transvalensis]|uniref:AcrR family transcriptional regulator n=1 Tax=Nocardia transvalensis TaxID=37333 RepID=A0A7W9PEW2_9NOCA|nr:TetR family transcriptional regulator [Nocardia transvalensis]MBB5914906.1 AcrR family transcriptional regulator [Nocardia transvalensis]
MTAETPQRRSDATRAAILAAARRRFAQDGFRKATIRAIAADADIDPSMVMRYYGNKEGLFDAALDVDLALPDLADADPDRLGELLARRFVELWDVSPGNEILLTLLRSAVTDETVVPRVQQIFAQQLSPVVLRLGEPADAPRRAGLIASQVLGLALCRYVFRLPPVVALTREQIVADIGPTLQRYLVSSV